MKNLLSLGLFVVSVAAAPVRAWDEGLKIFCNSERVVGARAHRDHFFLIPRVVEDRLHITLLSQDLECGRNQDISGRDVYRWLSAKNLELPYIVSTWIFDDGITTRPPRSLGESRLNSRREISFEDADPGVLAAFPAGTWEEGNLKMLTLMPQLSDLLGASLARDLLSGKVANVEVQLLARREFYSGGERFLLRLNRDSANGHMYARLIKY